MERGQEAGTQSGSALIQELSSEPLSGKPYAPISAPLANTQVQAFRMLAFNDAEFSGTAVKVNITGPKSRQEAHIL